MHGDTQLQLLVLRFCICVLCSFFWVLKTSGSVYSAALILNPKSLLLFCLSLLVSFLCCHGISASHCSNFFLCSLWRLHHRNPKHPSQQQQENLNRKMKSLVRRQRPVKNELTHKNATCFHTFSCLVNNRDSNIHNKEILHYWVDSGKSATLQL